MITDEEQLSNYIQGIKGLRKLLRSSTPITYDDFNKNKGERFMLNYGIQPRSSFTLFRATVLKPHELTSPISKFRFSYPDPARGVPVTRGRANIAGYPVFYGTESFAGAIMETILTGSDSKQSSIPQFIYVSEWRLINPTDFSIHNVVDYCEVDGSVFNSHELVNAHNIYIKQVAKCFTSKQAYDFTSIYSHNLLQKMRIMNRLLEAIRYPSVINDRVVNFALNPHVVSKFEMERVFKIELPPDTDPRLVVKFIKLQPVEIGRVVNKTSTDQIISWSPLTKIDMDFIDSLSIPNVDWVTFYSLNH